MIYAHRLLLAAQHLRRSASELAHGFKHRGVWDGGIVGQEAKKDHDEMASLAAELEAEAAIISRPPTLTITTE